MTNPVIKKEINARVSDGSLTRKEKIGGTKKKFRQRKEMAETTVDERKSPASDWITTATRKKKLTVGKLT